MAKVKYDVMRAEDSAVARVQAMALRLIDSKKVKQRDLAEKMAVSEARISQMFAADPKNLTIKTAARLFFHLGERLVFTCESIEQMDREAEKQNARKAAAARMQEQHSVWCNPANANQDFYELQPAQISDAAA